ncbi:hypothetical protein [Actinacidiphila yeochonensis]|uniref:hypothetical protein n=1 Tax=Actinacidiphila yeochonensis TaxID=89050 RepID=UPI0005624D35|nr:hypothetical protein [Actinacidiphila yeochonensis]
MGAFDQFKDKAEDYAEQAKGAAGKRNKSANAQRPERAERGAEQEARERRPEFEDLARSRVARDEDDESQNEWA